MCGIVGYIGNKAAKEILLQGLKSLSYRGYDSSGIALKDSSSLLVVKSEGKLENLEAKLLEFSHNLSPLKDASADKTSSQFSKVLKDRNQEILEKSVIGIGHTRWATHGKPNTINSHPHQDEIDNLTIVHNGIIKNFFSIKTKLEAEGFSFRSDTDTEVIVQLMYKFTQEGKGVKAAIKEALTLIDGSYALAILCKEEDKIYLAKNQSPLVIGIGEGENFIASDSSTIALYTNKLLRLKDKQVAEITKDNVSIEDLEGNPIAIQVVKTNQSSSIMEKGHYKHFLAKEIHEQPDVIRKMLELAFVDDQIKAFDELDFNFKDINKISFVACGSAYHAALVGKNIIEHWAKVPCEIAVASEFCSKPALVSDNDLVIGISQSGETADTLAAIKNASANNARVMAITNRNDSALYDLCEPNNYVTPAGIEVSVASTKAFTSQVLAMYLLALKICHDLELDFDYESCIRALRSLPIIIEETLERESIYKKQMLKFSNYRDFLFLSRGVNYPIALEGALKLKELSYIHATGYPSGEMKHGPIAILDSSVPVLNIAINGASEFEQVIYKKTLSNAEEAKARMSPSIVIACDSDENVESLFDDVIRVPDIDQIYSPIVATIPLQFLAYFIAEDLGKDVDQPRNLAKSVTVE